ncbi:type IVB secretion system protein IcmH/DotU [Xinfangfangia sp. CPCC 101601]|uniref:Type IVB secretion system protein IcmH/DotU n=1 Tax=Pseudogemmobacter lacusdianii TaxID=3069608 RepID=A0ABU0VW11_9RHOB|nr:type IVB secretion system protein IcmH/DotU [Xinfangfangia sp. CPCC 101601]MDQ2065698.1 type IVB secretion system protein IcmH/DotU [Xinfangfangia sp. CPCC 101601]
MNDKDDPFGLNSDAGRTRIRPVAGAQPLPPLQPSGGAAWGGAENGGAESSGQNWGGQSGHAWGGAPQPAFGSGNAAPPAAPRPRGPRAHANPFVIAFAPLLELAPELERAHPPAQPDVLRQRLQSGLVDARDAAVALGQPLARANQGAWFVAALLDDIALNTPWGGQSAWSRQPIVTSLTGQVDTGTRFFSHLEDLLAHPNRDPDLLELAYLCLGLGFRGQYRPQGATGAASLTALRAQIARVMRDVDVMAAPLSPHADGVKLPDEPRRFAVPLWTVWLIAAALIAAIYTGLSLQLGNKAEQLFVSAAALPPAERAGIFRPIRDTEAPEVPVPPVEPSVSFELLPLFTEKAPQETSAALQGREDVSMAVLVVRGSDPEVFRSAKSDIRDEYLPLISAIAAVILENTEVIGRVTVLGHTDSVPVQASNPFQSNQGLSEARAEAIAKLLIAAGVPADQVASEGRADTDPVGDNATKEGRALNRRIEIKIEKRL